MNSTPKSSEITRPKTMTLLVISMTFISVQVYTMSGTSPESEQSALSSLGKPTQGLQHLSPNLSALPLMSLLSPGNSSQLSGRIPSRSDSSWIGNQSSRAAGSHHPRFHPQGGQHAENYERNVRPHPYRRPENHSNANSYPTGPPHTYPYTNYGSPNFPTLGQQNHPVTPATNKKADSYMNQASQLSEPSSLPQSPSLLPGLSFSPQFLHTKPTQTSHHQTITNTGTQIFNSTLFCK